MDYSTAHITSASANHVESISELLKDAKLPYSDISVELLSHFIVLIHENAVLGTVGLEVYGEHALIRSLVLDEAARGNGFGKQLVHEIEEKARQLNINGIYLLTTTAAKFFEKEGYEMFDRKDVPEDIQKTTEFSFLCPDSATCMLKKL